ncbi:MAG: class I SAM-dependent methyltransferase [Candidatus Competibacter sp.]|nr:class I SAM-dependent methyltransferase [Candidatus Competibacter sp.]
MNPEAYQEMAHTENKHWWFVGRRRIMSAVIDALNLPSNATILEVGSGTGGNLAMLSKFGKVSAIEPDDFAREWATRKSNVVVLKGYLPGELPFNPANFDLICLFDVLEHIESDIAALQSLRPLLKPRGQIVLTVPAYQWLWSSHDEELHHRRRYTATSLAACCQQAGYGISQLSYYNTLLFPVAVAARLLDRLLLRPKAAGTGIPPELINRLFLTLFDLERYALLRLKLPFGVSLMAILKAD